MKLSSSGATLGDYYELREYWQLVDAAEIGIGKQKVLGLVEYFEDNDEG